MLCYETCFNFELSVSNWQNLNLTLESLEASSSKYQLPA